MTEAILTTLPWHQSKWQQVSKLLSQNTFPHALLLSGLAGQGKNQFACQLAQLLLCQNKQQKVCNQCSACQLFINKTHPDFINIVATTEGGSIKIDQIRQLNTNLFQSSYDDNPKVIIIKLAEQMTLACSNALLKILEEPPRSCVFMLISENVQALLPTIISRCQRWHFAPLQQCDYQQLKMPYQPLQLGSPLALAPDIETDKIIDDLISIAKLEQSPIEVAAIWLEYNWQALINMLFFILSDTIKISQQTNPLFFVNNNNLTELSQLLVLKQQHYLLREIYVISAKMFHNIVINKQLLLETLLTGLNYDN